MNVDEQGMYGFPPRKMPRKPPEKLRFLCAQIEFPQKVFENFARMPCQFLTRPTLLHDRVHGEKNKESDNCDKEQENRELRLVESPGQ